MKRASDFFVETTTTFLDDGVRLTLQVVDRDVHQPKRAHVSEKSPIKVPTSAQLIDAAKEGDSAQTLQLLANGAPINDQDEDGSTALVWAAAKGHNDIVRKLLDHRADVNLTPSTSSGNDSPLYHASIEGWEDIVKEMVELNVDVTRANNRDRLPLISAASKGYVAIVQLLQQHGAPADATNTKGTSPLILAAMYGNDEVVRVLLDVGANLELCDDNGWTPLRLASSFGHLAITRTLLKARALIEAECPLDRATALSGACDGWHLAEYLNEQGNHRQPTWHQHTRKDAVLHWEVARMLVAHGARLPYERGHELRRRLDAAHIQCCALLVLANRRNSADESRIAILPEELLLRVLQPLTRSFTMCDAKRGESEYRVSPTYMQSQKDINHRMRAILVDWLHEVDHKFKLKPNTLYLTVALIDRFLESEPILRSKLQLVGVAAMSIAEQYMHGLKWGKRGPAARKDYSEICDKAYSEEEILSMEDQIKEHLSKAGTCPLSTPTALTVLKWLLSLLPATQATFKPGSDFEKLALYLVDLTLQDYAMLQHVPGAIAASAIYIVLVDVAKQPPTELTTLLEQHTHLQERALLACTRDIRGLFTNAPDARLQAVYKKFWSLKDLRRGNLHVTKC